MAGFLCLMLPHRNADALLVGLHIVSHEQQKPRDIPSTWRRILAMLGEFFDGRPIDIDLCFARVHGFSSIYGVEDKIAGIRWLIIVHFRNAPTSSYRPILSHGESPQPIKIDRCDDV